MIDCVGRVRIRGIRKVGWVRLLRSVVPVIPLFAIVAIAIAVVCKFLSFGFVAFEDAGRIDERCSTCSDHE